VARRREHARRASGATTRASPHGRDWTWCACSLGARGVLLGRGWAYALAGGGGAEVSRMLRLIEAEMRVAMALTSRTSIAAIDRTMLVNSL
jgi:isopentenyl diphosphate isomerase/L-lactate dehydrogenase-like FMN-dependent dehydrogenase